MAARFLEHRKCPPAHEKTVASTQPLHDVLQCSDRRFPLVSYRTHAPVRMDSLRGGTPRHTAAQAAAAPSASLAGRFYKIFTTSQRLPWGGSLASEKTTKEIYGVANGNEFNLSLPGSAS